VTEPMGPSEAERQWALDRTLRAYSRYANGPEAGRWEAQDHGSRLALQARDRWLIQELAGRSPLLDLGCGDGNLALALAAAGYQPTSYVGVDLLPERVAIAESRVPWGTFHVAAADRLPLDDSSFDAVAAVTTLSSIPPELLPPVAREIGRVLRTGGVLVVYDLRFRNPGNPDVRPIAGSELRRLFPAWSIRSESMTLLPPLARTRLGGGSRRYRALTRFPFLRSHAGSVLTRP
jgi:ubiquinone/menaquinone biosynthesis C-methylase UbiE